MEVGGCCEQLGCQAYDFLPFSCTLCHKSYCLEHRSRFKHNCLRHGENDIVETRTIENSPSSQMKALFGGIETRFDSNQSVGSDRLHLNVSTSAIPGDLDKRSNDTSRIQNIHKLPKTGGHSAGSKAREILLKSKAIGDDRIAYEDRIYLLIKFPVESIEVPMYFASKLKIGACLTQIARNHPQACFQRSSKPDGISVVLFTDDSLDWTSWNQDWEMGLYLTSFESIHLRAVPTDDVVQNQSKFEAISTAHAAAVAVVPSSEQYKKGEFVHYKTSSGGMEVVRVVGVHMDDFPNVYYTIVAQSTSDGSSHERQTPHSRLYPVPVPSLSTSSGEQNSKTIKLANVISLTTNERGMSFQILHGTSKVYDIVNVTSEVTVGQLKSALFDHTNIPSNRMKLVYKGSVLGDDRVRIVDTKITERARVSLIGSIPAASALYPDR